MTGPIFPDLPIEPPTFEIVGTETRDGVLIRDIRLAARSRVKETP